MAKLSSGFVRNFVFGVEDSLVSTVGLVSGIAFAGVPRSVIVITGIILILVEAFSMGVGSLFSENSAEEFEAQHDVPLQKSLGGSLVMFVSYFLSGMFVILPYVFLPSKNALILSVMLALVSLFVLGSVSAKYSNSSVMNRGIQMVLIGGVAILIGAVAGVVLNNLSVIY